MVKRLVHEDLVQGADYISVKQIWFRVVGSIFNGKIHPFKVWLTHLDQNTR